jgi:hypothetical protein
MALSRTFRLLASGPQRRETWLAFSDALRGLWWVVRSRPIVPREVEAALRLLERRTGPGWRRRRIAGPPDHARRSDTAIQAVSTPPATTTGTSCPRPSTWRDS